MKPEPAYSEPSIPPETVLSAGSIVAQNLLIARTAMELTQQELAEASGISRATIAQLEAGVGDPRLSTLEMLAKSLRIPAHFLLLDQAAFRAMRELPAAADTPRHDEIARVLRAGGALGRLRAASLGVDAAVEAGLSSDAHRVGAAIGAARLARAGLMLGAHLAHLLERFRPASRAGEGKQADATEFNLGEGI